MSFIAYLNSTCGNDIFLSLGLFLLKKLALKGNILFCADGGWQWVSDCLLTRNWTVGASLKKKRGENPFSRQGSEEVQSRNHFNRWNSVKIIFSFVSHFIVEEQNLGYKK